MTAILVTRAGSAPGARVAAAALACAQSDPECAGLLIDLGARRAPRPTLVASAAARALEERLVSHLPEAGVAARGWTCHLALSADREGVHGLAAALPLGDDSIAVAHVPPGLFRFAIEELPSRVEGVLLRADLGGDRALAALAARDTLERGLRVAVLKEPLGWLASRRALAGLLPAGSGGGLPEPLCRRLLDGPNVETSARHPEFHGEQAVPCGEPETGARIQFRL